MATIMANGGAERFWKHEPTGTRAVLCRNGKLLIHRGRWRRPRETTREEIERDPAWQTDTSTTARAGVTRTTRAARRSGSADP